MAGELSACRVVCGASWSVGAFLLLDLGLTYPLFVRSEEIRESTVLELGSGVGFLGIVIAILQQNHSGGRGKGRLCMTDLNEDVLGRCRDNVRLSPSMRAFTCDFWVSLCALTR